MFFWRFIWYLCYNSVVYFCRIVKRSTRAATRKLVYSSFGLGVERDLAVISVFRSHLMMSADKLRENVMLSSIAMVWTERSVVLWKCRNFFMWHFVANTLFLRPASFLLSRSPIIEILKILISKNNYLEFAFFLFDYQVKSRSLCL